MNLGRAIKELRKQKGMSQVELAKAADITQAAMSGIENGNRPNTETLRRISKALQVSESLIYVMGMDREDVPEEKRVVYDTIYPYIQDLVLKIAN